jgi:LmbE family N-acetylglucosaminyl deacetylase
MAILGHPDDESLGIGGTLAKYASEGAEVFLLTATRGDAGRYRAHRSGEPGHPGAAALGSIREAELRAAASVLGVRDVALLDYRDGHLDRAEPREAIAAIASHLKRVRPDVVITFGPDGAYGHPDHIAVSQFATAAIVEAAEPSVAKLYYIAWPASTWAVYQRAFKKLTSMVDGVERQVVPWPEWEITTVIDTRRFCNTAWRAITCHESQMAIYAQLEHLPAEDREALLSAQSYYRVFSRVNGGRATETDLFEGIDA